MSFCLRKLGRRKANIKLARSRNLRCALILFEAGAGKAPIVGCGVPASTNSTESGRSGCEPRTNADRRAATRSTAPARRRGIHRALRWASTASMAASCRTELPWCGSWIDIHVIAPQAIGWCGRLVTFATAAALFTTSLPVTCAVVMAWYRRVVAPQRLVATGALAHEVGIVAIGLDRDHASAPAPTLSVLMVAGILIHQLHLDELARCTSPSAPSSCCQQSWRSVLLRPG